MKIYARLFATLAAISFATIATSQVSITSTGVAFTQNFDSYAGSAESLPVGWTLSSGTFRGTGTGTGNQGNWLAYGSAGDFSLGVLRTGSTEFTVTASFVNNTGATLTDLALSWNYEQYRYVNTAGFTVAGTGALSDNISLSSKGFTASASGTNGTATVTPMSITLTGLSILQGGTFGVSWRTFDAANSDSGFAIDNFSVTAAAVPEPSTYAAIFGAVALIGAAVHRRRQRAKLSPTA